MTTQITAASAAIASCSHAWVTSARNPVPGAEFSVNSSLPRSPYHPIAEALTSTSGVCCSRLIACTMVRVLCTRDSRIVRR